MSVLVASPINIIKSVDHQHALIEMRSDGILKVTFKDDFVMDVDAQEILFEIYRELCKDEKHPFMFSAMKDVVITKEARENSKKLEKDAPSLATAIVASSLPYRLMANFYQKFNKPKIPFKLFRREEEAVVWLLEKQEAYKKKKRK